MKLQFEDNQQYQLSAIKSVVDLFVGQPDASQINFSLDDKESVQSLLIDSRGVANRRIIDDRRLLENLNNVQQKNAIALSEKLETMRLANGKAIAQCPNFTVEMETGTGKTYVYLRTIYELRKQYGFRKFVIVVPSVAIREGVLASIRSTKEHFNRLYANEPVGVLDYSAKRINALRSFANANAIQILVINIDAFAKDAIEQEDSGKKGKGNVINQQRESGIRPIEHIQNTCPIVILDEPQNLETDNRKQAIARLNPLCTLRYSATHRNSYNLLYSLDPVNAFELGLVKQISVDSPIEQGGANQAFVELKGFTQGKRSISAKLCIWANQKQGVVKKVVSVKVGDDLYDEKLSNGRELYREGFIVNEIDAGLGCVRFANSVQVTLNRPNGVLGEAVLRLQIEATLRRHFEKAKYLHGLGIKVLSVFFIDRVDNYRLYQKDGTISKGKFADWFEELFVKIQQEEEFHNVLPYTAEQVHNGYFSLDKQSVSPFETRQGKTHTEAESSAFELIMRDKERLLSLDEPLSFIFSHSALREGWDNPNVFQICTLAESTSMLKKRQEIGRGLRLAVNQQGQRVRDKNINQLTVIANESYEDFARALQVEFSEAGVQFNKKLLKDGRDRVQVKLKKGYHMDPLFLELWHKISARTRYQVEYSTETLIEKAALRIKCNMPVIERPRIALSRASIDISREGVMATQTGYRTREVSAQYAVPDFIRQLQHKTSLTSSTVAKILLKCERLAEALNNPQLFIEYCEQEINAQKLDFLVYGDGFSSGVQYSKLTEDDDNSYYKMSLFEEKLINTFKLDVQEVIKQDKTLFTHIVIDNNSIPERAFAKACEDNNDIRFYIKLPNWFKIDTPVGTYNPDWALIWENDKHLYFVAETKSTGDKNVDLSVLRPQEQLRIECGKRHFAQFEAVRFKVVHQVNDLMG